MQTIEKQDTRAALAEVAAKILDWKQSQGWSHSQLAKQFRAIGSERSLARASKGENTGDTQSWLNRYRQVWTAMQEYAGITITPDEILPLQNIEQGRSETSAVVLASKKNPSMIDRLVIIEGGAGAGKTSTLKSLANDLAGTAIYMEATEAWNTAPAACTAILDAVGLPFENNKRMSMPRNRYNREQVLIKRLQKRTLLLIDEAHHMTGPALNLLKTILNRTPSIIAIAAIPTLWDKLTRTFQDESLQLRNNRLFARVQIPPPDENDTIMYMSPVVDLTPDEASNLCRASYSRGYYAYLRRVRQAIQSSIEEGEPMSVADAMGESDYRMGA